MKKVVSATLAGALAVGMVPAMALADDAIELQATTEADIAKGAITAYDTAEEGYIVPTEVTTLTGDVVVIGATGEPAVYTRYYKVVKDGVDSFAWSGDDEVQLFCGGLEDPTSKTWLPGTYYVTVGGKTAGEPNVTVMKFTIEASSLSGAYLYEVNALDAADTSDVEFAYTGKALDLELTLGVAGDLKSGDYAIQYYKKNAAGKWAKHTGDIVAAGEYRAEVKGAGKYTGSDFNLDFTVAKLNLAEAAIETVQAVAYKAAPAAPYAKADSIKLADLVEAVNGDTEAENAIAWANYDELVFVGDYAANETDLKPGKYTYLLQPKDNGVGKEAEGIQNDNVEGYASIDVVRYEKSAVIQYNGATPGAEPATPAAWNKKYDPAKITVTEADPAVDEDTDAVAYTVTYMKKGPDGYVETESIAAPGYYKAVVTVDDSTYEFGGQDEVYFQVAGSAVTAAADVFVTYKGKNVTSFDAVDYNGKDFLDNVEVQVVDAKGVKLVEGTDYVVSVVNTKAPKVEVDEVVDAGSYKLVVKAAEGSKYVFDSNVEMPIVINKAKITADIMDQITETGYAGPDALYTGKAVQPVLGFTVADDKGPNGVDKGTDPDAIEVPADLYTVTIKSYEDNDGVKATPSTMPTEFVNAGEYTFEIALDTKKAVNFEWATGAATSFTFNVVDDKVFPDVPADAWYADAVLKAAGEEWINGYGNGLFGPNDGMKRGDLALVIARYLDKPDIGVGMGDLLDGIVIGDSIVGIDTGFSDVKGGAYYAKAVKAMAEAGIITGYGDGTYGPEDLVTREQLATILARLDASGVTDESIMGLASALDAYVDGKEVCGWAVAGVEWAVENGIMGVNTKYLNPEDVVTRAEAAAMLVRYDSLA